MDMDAKTPRKRRKPATLTAKAKDYCQARVEGLGKRNAAIKAGYCHKSADVRSSQLEGDDRVSELISFLRAERAERVKDMLSADKVLLELGKLAFVSVKDLYNPETGKLLPILAIPDDVAACIESIDHTVIDGQLVVRRVKMYDKIKSLQLIGQHLEMFVEVKKHGADEKTMAMLELIGSSRGLPGKRRGNTDG